MPRTIFNHAIRLMSAVMTKESIPGWVSTPPRKRVVSREAVAYGCDGT